MDLFEPVSKYSIDSLSILYWSIGFSRSHTFGYSQMIKKRRDEWFLLQIQKGKWSQNLLDPGKFLNSLNPGNPK